MCDSAARAAASERPTFRQATGLPASAQRSQRVDEGVGAPDRLEEEPDRARAVVLGEEREVVRGIHDCLRAGGDHAAQADAAPQRQERVRDRSGLAEDRDVSRRGRVLRAAVPRGRAARDVEAHAVRAEQRRAELPGPCGEALRRRLGGSAGFRTDTGHDERADSGRRGFLERGLHALVVDHEERELGHLRQIGDGSGSTRRPATSSRFGFTPHARTPLSSTVSTAATLRGDAPTTAIDDGKRSERTPDTARILAMPD